MVPFDAEVLNSKLHERSVAESTNDPSPNQEFVVLGLKKGAVHVFHVNQLTQVFCRFTVHREAIKIIKYLPKTRTFISFCDENQFKVWQILPEKRINLIKSIYFEKTIDKMHVISTMAEPFISPPNTDRFLIIFKTGESELFEYSGENEELYHLENEKQKEHDTTVTGCDSNKFVNLLVTSDSNGMVRIWNLDKRFLREIQFPHSVDGVCFLNCKGDILVSHVERISHIKFETYWRATFTQFGVTKTTDEVHRTYKATQASIETELYDDFIVDKAPPRKTKIVDEYHLSDILRDN